LAKKKKSKIAKEVPLDELMLPKSLYAEIISLFRDIWGEIGMRFADAMLISLLSHRLQFDKTVLEVIGKRKIARIRQHLLLYWSHGWTKTSLLKFTKNFLLPKNLRVKWATDSSSAALRGSVLKGKIFPPRIAIYDIFIVPELSSWLQQSGESNIAKTLGILNTALEEGEVEADLVKFINIDEFARQEAEEEWGIKITREGTMKYTTNTVFWAATHTLDVIPKMQREAFLSRFNIIRMPPNILTTELSEKIVFGKPSFDYEYLESLRQNLENFLSTIEVKPYMLERAIRIAKEVVSRAKASARIIMSPRIINSILMTSMFYSVWLDKAKDELISEMVERRVNDIKFGGQTTEEIMMNLLKTPRTPAEIASILGMRRSLVYYYLKRIPVEKIRDPKTGRVKYKVVGGWDEEVLTLD